MDHLLMQAIEQVHLNMLHENHFLQFFILDIHDLNIINDFIKNDSRDSFTLLFKRYAKKILNLALYYYNDKEEAEEIVQEVFLKIWIKRKSINKPEAFESLLYKTAKNLIFDSLKKQVHIKAYAEYLKWGEFHYQTKNTEDTIFYNELNHFYNELLEKLPPKRKEVFILSRKEGLSNKEIAAKLQIFVRTVEEHVRQSIQYLKKIINKRYDLLILFIMFHLI